MGRRLEFRYRIGLLVVLAAAGLVAVAAVTFVLGQRNRAQMRGIETRYVPLVELDRDLKLLSSQTRKALEDAAASADETRLAEADTLHDELVRRLRAGAEMIAANGGDEHRIEAELARYYTAARAVSAAIVGGKPAEELEPQVAAMRDLRRTFATDLDASTRPNREGLTAAFTSARQSLDESLWTDIAVALGVLALMGGFSWWIIRRTVRSLEAVSSGVERLALGDFDHEIDVPAGDEIGDLARQANQTAGRLREYRAQIERDDWIKSGVAELGHEIAGELEPPALARRAMTYLAIYTGTDAAVVYLADDAGRFELIDARGAAADSVRPRGFAADSARTDADDAALAACAHDGQVRDVGRAFVCVTPERAIAHALLIPCTHEDRTLAVIALGFAAPPAERAIALAGRVREVVGVALRVAEAHRRAQTLLSELRQAYDTLENAKNAADAANRELEAFSYSVSHDLRSPLRAIDGFSQALLERNAAQLDAKGGDYLRRVRAAAQRMGELIDALLQLSQINRVAVGRTRVDLSEIARALSDEIARRAPERTVTFAIAEGLVADADARMVRALLDNLLGNAWKFTAKTAAPRIELSAQQDHGITVYCVRDNGAGFDMAYAAKLFAPFQRLHTQAEFAGTGIGLATVRRIVDRHGGRVWAEGAVDRGAAVFFTLAPNRGGP